MANLIITVISIALVAVAALMGAYYGGTAFMDGQAKAYANTIAEQAKQIKGGYTLYLNDGNAAFAGNITLNGTGSDTLTSNSKYFYGVVTPPKAVAPGSWAYQLSSQRFTLTLNNYTVCTKLAQLYTGQDPLEGIANFSLVANRVNQFGAYCYWTDSNSSGAYDSTDPIYFQTKAQ